MTSKRWADPDDAEVFFGDDAMGLAVFHRVLDEVDACGGAELRVAPTQVGWARRRGFAFLWSASRWLGDSAAPVVASARWKQVVQIRPGLCNHHLEIRDEADLDDEVLGWVREAYVAAG
jgi:hypothetical protein